SKAPITARSSAISSIMARRPSSSAAATRAALAGPTPRRVASPWGPRRYSPARLPAASSSEAAIALAETPSAPVPMRSASKSAVPSAWAPDSSTRSRWTGWGREIRSFTQVPAANGMPWLPTAKSRRLCAGAAGDRRPIGETRPGRARGRPLRPRRHDERLQPGAGAPGASLHPLGLAVRQQLEEASDGRVDRSFVVRVEGDLGLVAGVEPLRVGAHVHGGVRLDDLVEQRLELRFLEVGEDRLRQEGTGSADPGAHDAQLHTKDLWHARQHPDVAHDDGRPEDLSGGQELGAIGDERHAQVGVGAALAVRLAQQGGQGRVDAGVDAERARYQIGRAS